MQGLNEVRARCLKTPRLHSGVIPPDQTTSFRRGHDYFSCGYYFFMLLPVVAFTSSVKTDCNKLYFYYLIDSFNCYNEINEKSR